MDLHHTWSRRPRLTLGQQMGVVLGAALLMGMVVPTAGASLRERLSAVLDVLLLLPLAGTVFLALTGREPARRRGLARFLASGPALVLTVLFFVLALLGSIALLTTSPGPLPAGRTGWRPDRFLYLAAGPIAYAGMILALLARPCPHCGERSLARWRPVGLDDPETAPELFRCDDCGACCWRGPGGTWIIEPDPSRGDLTWFATFAPKLRDLRRKMRPS